MTNKQIMYDYYYFDNLYLEVEAVEDIEKFASRNGLTVDYLLKTGRYSTIKNAYKQFKTYLEDCIRVHDKAGVDYFKPIVNALFVYI